MVILSQLFVIGLTLLVLFGESHAFRQITFGENVSPAVQKRISGHLANLNFPNLTNITFSCGNSSLVKNAISNKDLQQVGPEGFVLHVQGQNIFGDGNPSQEPQNIIVGPYSLGAHYACYQLLSQVFDFAFLHPLQPVSPNLVDTKWAMPQLIVHQQMRWPVRGFHTHTEHPLELMNVLNGFGNGMSTNISEFQAMLPEVELYAEWLTANLQNRIQWIILGTEPWLTFAASQERQQRMQQLNQLFHAYGVATGADMPIAEVQQHAWFMVRDPLASMEEQKKMLTGRMDWLHVAGFDFLATENGFTEFTHPDDIKMLTWINATANYLADTYGKRSYIKCHCSTGQVCEHYNNPWTGEPLNFNFLPIYATEKMGIYPHTVQMYTFEDPAPTYGNTNMYYMFEFLKNVTLHQTREVIYHGETAYWVNYDIDVPLFLPTYAYGRLWDLRLIATAEEKAGRKMNGQIDFSSGWEWGYWLNDVVTAAAAVDPLLNIQSTEQALEYYFLQIGRKLFPKPYQAQFSQLLSGYTMMQRNKLILGLIQGKSPADIVDHNGQGYLEGWDTWSSLESFFVSHAVTQPNRISLERMRLPLSGYKAVRPLLQDMAQNFTAFASSFESLLPHVYPHALPFFQDILDSTNITALRAVQIFNIYDYINTWLEESKESREAMITRAYNCILSAQEVVSRREKNYRVPVDRIAGWYTNPTSYNYGYIWTTHSLFYFWRDYEQALDANLENLFVQSPCYMNIIDPTSVIIGGGIIPNVSDWLRQVAKEKGWQDIGDCLGYPLSEPHYPISSPNHNIKK